MARPTPQDLFRLGLPSPSAARQPMRVESVVAASGWIIHRAHGLAEDEAVTLRISGAGPIGSPALLLPGGLVALVHTYGVHVVTPEAIQLKDSPGGSVIASFTDAGTGDFSLCIDPTAAVQAAIDMADSIVQEYLRAHSGDVVADSVSSAVHLLAIILYVSLNHAADPKYRESYAMTLDVFRTSFGDVFKFWRGGGTVRQGIDATPTVPEMGAVLVPLAGRRYQRGEDEDRA